MSKAKLNSNQREVLLPQLAESGSVPLTVPRRHTRGVVCLPRFATVASEPTEPGEHRAEQ